MGICLDGLDKAEVLAALYNASHPEGIGFLHYAAEPMKAEQARALLAEGTYFDYLQGRVMKIDLSGDDLDPRLYDRDNGEGAAEKVINAIRTGMGVTNSVTAEAHQQGLIQAAGAVRRELEHGTRMEESGNLSVITLGLDDMAHLVGPAVDKALGEG